MNFPSVNRRRFIQTAAAAPFWPGWAGSRLSEAAENFAPPRVLYSNDTTHITSCVSPFRDPKDGFTDDHLRASIREAKDADVHLLQPGLGWVPWWNSKIYSPQDHYETFLGAFGPVKPHAIARYLLAGGDLVRTLIEECRALQIKAFVSYRLNDGHHVRGLVKALEEGKPAHDMARHYWENYERFRIGPNQTNWDEGVFDWSHPEVRAYKFSLIQELVDTYPLDGLELDFLRHWSRFPAEGIPAESRREITTGFVKSVREALDRATGNGPRRTLCIRVPADLVIHEDQGIHLPSLVAAGVDWVTLSWSYFTLQDDNVRRAKELIPETPVYAEMTHTTLTGRALGGSGTQPYLRTTDEQFYTTANLARSQGGAGVSLFNFPYYREHTTPKIGPFSEPPFPVLAKLKDADFLSRQSPSYFLTAARKDPVLPHLSLPVLLQRNDPAGFSFEIYNAAGSLPEGILRIRSDEPIADRKLRVECNGSILAPTAFVEKPIPHPYKAFLGDETDTLCFSCPGSLARQGINDITVTLEDGIRVRVIYLDLSFPL